MEAMIRAGDPTGALRHFQLHAARVRAELDCPPSWELLAPAESANGGASTLAPLAAGLSRAAKLRVLSSPARWIRRARVSPS